MRIYVGVFCLCVVCCAYLSGVGAIDSGGMSSICVLCVVPT